MMPFNLSQKEKDLILKIADGNMGALQVIPMFCRLSSREEVLRRLYSNGLIGQRFLDWFYKENKGSFLSCAKMLLNLSPGKKLIAGVDFF